MSKLALKKITKTKKTKTLKPVIKSKEQSKILQTLIQKFKEIELAYNLSPKLSEAGKLTFKNKLKSVLNSNLLLLSVLAIIDPTDFQIKHHLIYSLHI